MPDRLHHRALSEEESADLIDMLLHYRSCTEWVERESPHRDEYNETLIRHRALAQTMIDRLKSESGSELCNAQDWADDGDHIHIYGTCGLPAGHESSWHQEWRDGKLWAEWRGPVKRAPSE